MTTSTSVSDQSTRASGDQEETLSAERTEEITQESKDTVKYETYKRTVGDVKKWKSRASQLEEENAEFKRIEREREEKDLEAKGEYAKIKDNLIKERDEAKAKADALIKEQVDNRKLGAFLGSLGGTVDREYWPLINIEEIAIDPDTKDIDELSVKRLVDTFKSKHSRLIDGVKGPRVSDSTPDRSSKITVEEWRKLPLKERKERMGDIAASLIGKQE